MTNEQAIDWLVAIKEKYIHGGDEGFDEFRKEALDMAVKALKEERLQGDWVRKEDIIHYIATQYSEHNELVPIWLSIGDLKE